MPVKRLCLRVHDMLLASYLAWIRHDSLRAPSIWHWEIVMATKFILQIWFTFKISSQSSSWIVYSFKRLVFAEEFSDGMIRWKCGKNISKERKKTSLVSLNEDLSVAVWQNDTCSNDDLWNNNQMIVNFVNCNLLFLKNGSFVVSFDLYCHFNIFSWW